MWQGSKEGINIQIRRKNIPLPFVSSAGWMCICESVINGILSPEIKFSGETEGRRRKSQEKFKSRKSRYMVIAYEWPEIRGALVKQPNESKWMW